MKPVLVVTGDFTPLGGMDAGNYALARHLATRGEVHLVAHRVWPDLLALPNVIFHRVPKLLRSNFASAPLLAWVGRRWAARIAARGGRVIVNGGNCAWQDVNWVHYVHATHAPLTVGTPLRRALGRWQHQRYVAAERRNLTQARLIITNSRRTRREIIAEFGVAEDRAHTVYYGCDSARFRPAAPEERLAARAKLGWSADRRTAIFVGALGDRRKGFDVLYGAWQALCARGDWDVDLAVVGAGAELPAWKGRVVESGLGERIQFLGFRGDVPDLLRAGDLLIHPARYEAYGLSVHEAICCGLPALVSASAGVAERYPAELGDLLIPAPLTAEGLTGRLLNWRSHMDPLRAATSEFGARLRAYTWDHMAQEIMTLIESHE